MVKERRHRLDYERKEPLQREGENSWRRVRMDGAGSLRKLKGWCAEVQQWKRP